MNRDDITGPTLIPVDYILDNVDKVKRPEPTRRERAKKVLYKEGLPSITIKFVINDAEKAAHKCYLTVASFEDQVDMVSLTLSGLQEHNIRALIESECRLFTKLLRSGTPLKTLVDHWEGYRFEPHGVCKQLVEHHGYDRPTVASTLDCVAKILRARFLK